MRRRELTDRGTVHGTVHRTGPGGFRGDDDGTGVQQPGYPGGGTVRTGERNAGEHAGFWLARRGR
jgi:hypothetical protein